MAASSALVAALGAGCVIPIEPVRPRPAAPGQSSPPGKVEMAWQDWYPVARDHVALTGDRPLELDGAPTLPDYADNIELLTGQVIRFRLAHRLEGVERTGTAVGVSWGADVGGS